MFKNFICQNKNWVFQNFPFLENDFDALTDYELFCKMVEYAKSLAITNEKFISELKNDLDTMYNEGKFDSLIMEIINLQITFTFDSVSDLKLATSLISGNYVRTSGFYSFNDGGGAYYKVREKEVNETINEMSLIALSDETLVAEIIKNNVNVKQYGAKGDDNNDDTLAIQTCINENKIVYIPSGIYKTTDSLNIYSSEQKIYGDGSTLSVIKKYGVESYSESISYNETVFDYGDYPSIFNLIFTEDTNISHVEINKLHLISNTNNGNNGITAPHTSFSIFREIRTNNCIRGIQSGGWINKIYDCDILTNNDVGIVIEDGIYFVINGSHSNSIGILRGNGIYVSNSAFDNGYPCFTVIDSPSVYITNCSTETYRQVLINNNSYVNIYGCDLEGHSSGDSTYFKGFFRNVNSGETYILNSNIHYEDYNTIGNPDDKNIVKNEGGNVTLIDNKITTPYTYTNSLSNSSTTKIDDKIESTVSSVIKKTGKFSITPTLENELLRLPFDYGKGYMFKIKVWGVTEYREILNKEALMSATSSGADSELTDDINVVDVQPSDGNYTGVLHLEIESGEVVLYYVANSLRSNSTINLEIDYSSN